MVRLTRIYTRGGDSGETSLGDGARALTSARQQTVDAVPERCASSRHRPSV